MASELKKKTHQKQYERLVEMMKDKPDIARNFTSRSPEETNAFWSSVTDALNNLGPPCREVVGWKKVWSDYKTYIKKKLVANAKECTATGGGPFKQKTFTGLEESVIALMNTRGSVTGIGARSFGEIQNNDNVNDNANEVENITAEPSVSSPFIQQRPRGRKPLTSLQMLSKQIKYQESTSRSIKDMASKLKRVNDNLSQLKEIEKDKLKELRQHNKDMLKVANAKLDLKRKILELEIQKVEAMLQK